MEKKVEMILRLVDNWVYDRYGYRFITEDGNLNMKTVYALADKTQEKDIDINRFDEDISIVVSEASENDKINFVWNENDIIMYVPKDLQEKIQFSVEYILSGFDKVQDAISSVSKEFQVNREGAIINAEKELTNCENDFTYESKQIIIACINNVGDAIEQTRKSIVSVCEEVESIPKDRKQRVFKTPVNAVLSNVMRARVSVYDYVYASAIYAELNLKIGRKYAAVKRIQDSIQFFKDMRDKEKFWRVEEWNELKDMFWKTGINEQIILLEEKLEEIMEYNGRIEIKYIIDEKKQ